MSTLGERIKEIRKSLPGKVSQTEFASMLSMSRDQLATYELDKVVPSPAAMQLMCTTFFISRTWLETGEGPMSTAPETPDEQVDERLANGSELAKACLRVIARTSDEDLRAFYNMFMAIDAEVKKTRSE